MSSLTGRAFVTFSDVTKIDQEPQVGGRVDYRHSVRDFDLCYSATDATARDADAFPALKDGIVTADTKFRGARGSTCRK